MSSAQASRTVYRKDYKKPAYHIDSIDLLFDLQDNQTIVTTKMQIRKDLAVQAGHALELYGDELILDSIKLDGEPLPVHRYTVTPEKLTVVSPRDQFSLEMVTILKPHENTALSGLYISAGNYCTQCEAEGFRRITYFLDRPDVMSTFSTTIIANKKRYPILLSNGNCIERGDFDSNRHRVKWEDPFKKPSYLFALVAGDFDCLMDEYTTISGRCVQLEIYVEKGEVDKAHYAMHALKLAMAWDEKVYGREYDLNIFMIVAVSSFNMGAMENKGLNIFNSKYILVDEKTATDEDYEAVLGVVGHEYFHNWTGNRITCRDWFQLCLKEGFTVFRDQSFTADHTSQVVKRIIDVKILRANQFLQDASPMSHPVRPDSYMEINNFYTVTVYEKGAEVFRMLHTILGADMFRKATDRYFERFDGQARTMDDVIDVMEEASDLDLSQFRLWYSQSGTPQVTASTHYDPDAQTLKLTLSQETSPTADQSEKYPLHIPIAIGFLDKNGNDIPLVASSPDDLSANNVLSFKNAEQTFEFKYVTERPVLSLARNFSAPIKLVEDIPDDDYIHRMMYDSDSFNRWEAGYQYSCKMLLNWVSSYKKNQPLILDEKYCAAFTHLLDSVEKDSVLIAEMLALPDIKYLCERMDIIDTDSLHIVYTTMMQTLAKKNYKKLLAIYENNEQSEYKIDPASIAQRRLRNRCLHYLATVKDRLSIQLIVDQYRKANNMTDKMAALWAINDCEHGQRDILLTEFYDAWQKNDLVINKWLSLQARSLLPNALDKVRGLVDSPSFTIKNPNKVYALIAGFCAGNPIRFHDKSGAGYQFLTEKILELNAINPLVAARLVEPLTHWRRYDKKRQEAIRMQLMCIKAEESLSTDVYEIVAKSL